MIGRKNEHKQILILSAMCWAYYITAFRGIRWPNEWAIAHWLINYKSGFIKRGFPGTLISPLIRTAQNDGDVLVLIRLISILFFIVFSIAILFICLFIVKRSNFRLYSILVVMVFLTSPYIVMSAHLIGYFDNIIIIISILSGLLIMKDKVFLSSILISLGILIHETTLLIGFPCVVFLAFIKQTKVSTNPKQILIGLFKKYRSLVLLPVLTILFIFFYQILFSNQEEIKKQLLSNLSQFNFLTSKNNKIFSTLFTISFQDYLKYQSPLIFNRILSKVYLVYNIPSLFILLCYGWYIFTAFPLKRVLFSIFTIISFLPLALHTIATDTSRIWTYPIVVSILAIWEVSNTLPENSTKTRVPLLIEIFAVIIIVFQLFILVPLMDKKTELFSFETRILLYAPLLLIIAIYNLNNYKTWRTANNGYLTIRRLGIRKHN